MSCNNFLKKIIIGITDAKICMANPNPKHLQKLKKDSKSHEGCL